MSYENDKHPKMDRRDEIAVWEKISERTIPLDSDVQDRAREIARLGVPALDAVHLASAVIVGAEVVLSGDDVMIRRARRLGLGLRVLNPVAYCDQSQTDE